MLEFLLHIWDVIFFSIAFMYHACVSDVFFNTACEEETFLEEVADTLLIPYQYAFIGRVAIQREDHSWYFKQRFDYSDHFWIKNIPCWLTAPVSLVAGGTLKAIAHLSPEVQKRYKTLKQPQPVHLHTEEYRNLGLFTENPISEEWVSSQGALRRPGDEKQLSEEKECLKEIAAKLTSAGILWWVDCGTCLGTYRYGGAIPWDMDVDIGILEPDFENVYALLQDLPSERYVVVDLSSRDRPFSLLKIYMRNDPDKAIDIYHFRINPEEKTLSFILSQENHIFESTAWKIREQPFKIPVAFQDVFPLKRALFDGIEVFVPHNPAKYLSRIYGEDLSPAKKYNPKTDCYEKDLSHPYWQRAFAH